MKKVDKKKKSKQQLYIVGGALVLLLALGLGLGLQWTGDDFAKAAMREKQMNRINDCVVLARSGVERDPSSVMAHYVYGLCLADQAGMKGQNPPQEAIDHYEIAAKSDVAPYNWMSLNNAAAFLDMFGQSEKALNYYIKAIELNPDFRLAHINIARIYAKFGEQEKCDYHNKRANQIEFNGALELHIATALPLVYDSQKAFVKTRKNYIKNVEALAKKNFEIPNPLDLWEVPHFYLGMFGKNDVETYKLIAKVLQKAAPSINYVAPWVQQEMERRARGEIIPVGNRKIRVGFTTMFFREHASGKMIQGIIENLPRDKFHVAIFSIVDHRQGQGIHPNDPVHARVKNRADSLYYVDKISLQHMRKFYEDERLDVLVFAELGMDPGNYALAFSRLAPVQVLTHGHASSSGIPTMDYYVSYKPFEGPNAQEFYSEQLVTFDDFSFYYPPAVPAAENLLSREQIWDRLGVPHQGYHIYLCPQTLFKIVPDFDTVFLKILQEDTKGIMVLKEFRTPQLNQRMAKRLRSTMPPDILERIKIVRNLDDVEWYSALGRADVLLDSYPFGGYTSSMETFSVGTPIVTLPHEMMAGRCTAAFYRMMGISETIANSREEYAQIAIKLGTNATFRNNIRSRIQANVHKLFHRTATVPQWTEFLTQAAENRPITSLHNKKK